MKGSVGHGVVPQLHQLTGLRGLAAWAVVLYHLRGSLTDVLPTGLIAAFGYGYLAVDVFFIMSGMVMWLNYADWFASRGWSGAPGFWWRRIARIWPLHAAILLALTGFASLLILTGRDVAAYPFAELPLHFLLIQNWGFTQDLSWNDPAWSISAEMGAYALFPLLALAVPWRRLGLPGLMATGLLIARALHWLFASLGHDSLGQAIPTLGLWRCLAGFSLGIVLANGWHLLRDGDTRLRALAAAVAGGALLLAGPLAGAPQTATLPAAFALLLLALSLDRGPLARLLGSAPLRRLGDVSYATYLAHVPLFTLFKLLFVGADLQLGAGGLAGFAALLLALSALLYHRLEKPAQAWLRGHPPRIVDRRRAAIDRG